MRMPTAMPMRRDVLNEVSAGARWCSPHGKEYVDNVAARVCAVSADTHRAAARRPPDQGAVGQERVTGRTSLGASGATCGDTIQRSWAGRRQRSEKWTYTSTTRVN
jgi:hypothetical protein